MFAPTRNGDYKISVLACFTVSTLLIIAQTFIAFLYTFHHTDREYLCDLIESKRLISNWLLFSALEELRVYKNTTRYMKKVPTYIGSKYHTSFDYLFLMREITDQRPTLTSYTIYFILCIMRNHADV